MDWGTLEEGWGEKQAAFGSSTEQEGSQRDFAQGLMQWGDGVRGPAIGGELCWAPASGRCACLCGIWVLTRVVKRRMGMDGTV